MVLAITLPSHLEKLRNSVCKFSNTSKHQMLNKSFISLKLDAQSVIHNNPIHTVNLNITLAFKKSWQPLKIFVILFCFVFVFVLCQTISKHGYRNSDLSYLMSVVPLCQGTKEMGALVDTERPSAAAHLCFKLSTQ